MAWSLGLTALGLFLIIPAQERTWLRADTGIDGTGAYIDFKSLREGPAWADGTRPRRVWVKYDFSKVKNEKARSNLQLLSFDCKGQTHFLISSVVYAPNGAILSSASRPDNRFEYEPIVPDSLAESFARLVCLDPE